MLFIGIRFRVERIETTTKKIFYRKHVFCCDDEENIFNNEIRRNLIKKQKRALIKKISSFVRSVHLSTFRVHCIISQITLNVLLSRISFFVKHNNIERSEENKSNLLFFLFHSTHSILIGPFGVTPIVRD